MAVSRGKLFLRTAEGFIEALELHQSAEFVFRESGKSVKMHYLCVSHS